MYGVPDTRRVAKAQIGLQQGGYTGPSPPQAGLSVRKPQPTAPHVVKAPSPFREVIVGNTTK